MEGNVEPQTPADKCLPDDDDGAEDMRSLLRKAKYQSSGVGDFSKRSLSICFRYTYGTVFFVSWVCGLLVLPTVMLFMGSRYVSECTVDPFLPQFLIVAGAVCLSRGLIHACMIDWVNLCKKRPQTESHENDPEKGDSDRTRLGTLYWIRNNGDYFLILFIIAWFIAGTVSTYSIDGTYQSATPGPTYCSDTLYTFTYWLVTSVLIFAVSIFSLLGLCLCVLYAALDSML